MKLSPLAEFDQLDALVLAVSHREFIEMGGAKLAALVKPGGVLIDVKSALDSTTVPAGTQYWCL